jgi:primosomal protein N' (replication factor Y)
MQILKVIPAIKIPLPQTQVLTYFSTLPINAGSLILITLRNKKILGLVIESQELKEAKMRVRKASFSLKKINQIINSEEIIDKRLRELVKWTSLYYWEPLGVIIKSVLPNVSLNKWKEISCNARPPSSSAGRWQGEENAKIKKKFWIKIPQKTLFLQIKKYLKQKKQILFLCPEIAKLENFYQKLPKNIQDKTIIYHGSMKKKELWENWKKTYQGESCLILSTRHGVFLPFKNLGIIFINGESSLSYKSWDQHPKINAKHIALKLAEIHSANIILTDIAPSLEAYWNIKEKRYVNNGGKNLLLQEKQKVEIADMKSIVEKNEKNFSYFSSSEKNESNLSYFSASTINAVRKALSEKKKILFLQNRRGGATYIFCKDCGYFYQCPRCEFSLVYHYTRKKLVCHWCGYEENPPQTCRKCQSHRLKYSGRGTQRINKEINALFPEIPIYLIDNDATPLYKDKIGMYGKFKKEKQCSLLITTSSILSMPPTEIELSVFLNFDLISNIPDFSANEYAMQFAKKINNISRKMIIQTYEPHSVLIKMIRNGEYDKIYKRELSLRQKMKYPPFWQIIKLKYKNRNEIIVEKESARLYGILEKFSRNDENIRVLGPLPSSQYKIKNYYQRIIILKVKKGQFKVRNKILKLVSSKWDIDVDPIKI